jgi:hypothetical protein
MQTRPSSQLARNFSGFLQSVKGPGARDWYASTNSSQASLSVMFEHMSIVPSYDHFNMQQNQICQWQDGFLVQHQLQC